MTIGETYFFRDPNLLLALENDIFPQLFKIHEKDKTIRIWCAGCSSGEEPYSIAILLHRLLPSISEWNIVIIGSDINPVVLKKAEKGQYKVWSFRAMPPAILKRYFTKINKEFYELVPEIRGMVNFQNLNLIDSPTFNQVDLILCQNVLIYFSPEQILKTLQLFVLSLHENGWLCVSAVETPYVLNPFLHPISFPNATFFKKSSQQHLERQRPKKPLFPASFTFSQKKTPAKPQHKVNHFEVKLKNNPAISLPSINEVYESCLSLYKEGHYASVISSLEAYLAPLKTLPLELKQHIDKLQLLISAYANQGKLDQALHWCECALRADKTNPYLYFMYATILLEQSQLEKALQAIDQALYLDSDFISAYYLGGTLHHMQGFDKTASRYLRNAMDLLLKCPPQTMILGIEDLNAEKMIELIQVLLTKINER